MSRHGKWGHGQMLVGVLLVGICLLLALFAPQISPQPNPEVPEMFLQVGKSWDLEPHSPVEVGRLGTMPRQLDVLHTLVWGIRPALTFGLRVVLASWLFGVFYGAAAAYVGGAIGQVMMAVADAFLTFPVIAAVAFIQQLVIVVLEKSGGYWSLTGGWYFPEELTLMQKFWHDLNPLMVALMLFSWMAYARIVHSNALRLKNQEYVTAARALGAGSLRVLIRHLLPNSIAPAVALAARDVGAVVVLQATFTFIGLGGGSPWGEMLSLGRSWVVGVAGNPFVYWWTFVPVTLTLICFSLGWNFLGDGLNEWLNPRRGA